MPSTPFQLFYNGINVTIETDSDHEIQPIMRLCSTDTCIYLLCKNHDLFIGNLNNQVDSKILHTTFYRKNIIDIELYGNIFYLIDENGNVFTKNLNQTANNENLDEIDDWIQVFFDNDDTDTDEEFCKQNTTPIKMKRVKCNAIGSVFLSTDNQLYGQGSCGTVLTNSKRPIKLITDFYPRQTIIDISCGEDFFIILTQIEIPDQDDLNGDENTPVKKFTNKVFLRNSRKTSSLKTLRSNISCNTSGSSSSIIINKSDSKDSIGSANSMTSSIAAANELDIKIQDILRQGYYLINTTVHSFGATNNGVLGTGDHIKRLNINDVLNLDRIGCYTISCGKEHSLARTLDGRIFHWGLNSQKQIDSSANIRDITSPKELNFDYFQIDEHTTTVIDSNILDAYCSDFRTILCNNKLEIFENPFTNSTITPSTLSTNNKKLNRSVSLEEKVFKLHSLSERNSSIILTSNKFTFINKIYLNLPYHEFFNAIQYTMQLLLKNSPYVNFLKYTSQTSPGDHLKFTVGICQGYCRMLYCWAACLKTVEVFYRNECSFQDLQFVKSSSEMIKMYQDYTKLYCDIKSIGGYTQINKILDLNGTTSKIDDYEKIFAVPFQQLGNIVQFIDVLSKNNYKITNTILNCLQEKVLEWQDLLRSNRIDIELAEHTHEFWLKNSRNVQILPFKRRSRRVILDSSNIPLKISTGGTFSHNAFILFSDCLCQYGSQLHTYPLLAMWIKMEGEQGLRIFTPEKTFLLSARSHEHKMLWFDQLVSSILSAMNRPNSLKLSNVRTTCYTFSDKHQMYPGVRAYGRWRLGIMHGTCYLEYPDGKIYFGDMKTNQIDGFGKMILPSMGIYEGNFKAGKFHGYGVYELKDNTIYEGNFRDGLFHGHGAIRTNTYTYVGEFSANSKNGYGIYDDTINGDKYMGMFAENKRIGTGTLITMNGDYFEGFFVNDEISGDGLAIFENGYYYEGDLTTKGPSGKGTYYMPSKENPESVDDSEDQMIGNIISGCLGGNWTDVRVISGSVSLNKIFPKFPHKIGELVVDNNRKWRSLFDNWEEEIFGVQHEITTKDVWNKIAIFMTSQKEKEKSKRIDSKTQNASSYFATNITLQTNYADLNLTKFSTSLDKISLRSTASLYTKPSTYLDCNNDQRKSHSNEQLFEKLEKFDKDFERYYEENSALTAFNYLINFPQLNCGIGGNTTRTSMDSLASLTDNNNIIQLDYVPTFGITTLTGNDVEQIKEYLAHAFKDPHHPLSFLNQRISNCFYTSYGCWKVKPTPILAYQAIKEWESISLRVYNIVRRLFPALPEFHCKIEGYLDVISHISLLYPIVLSEGVYSTLFVLYANKFSQKDELYRQRIMSIDKKTDEELADFLLLERSFLYVIKNELFQEAITQLKQVTEEYSPKGMLDVIEKSMQLISDAHKIASENIEILAADSMIPLTIFLIIRANVPHLGAELDLLDDLTGEENFELNMSGSAGYCYTTLQAAYEHIIHGSLFKT